MNSIQLFFRQLGHYISFPFVLLSLLLKIRNSKDKYLTYEAEGEEVKADARYEYVFGMVKRALFLANTKINYIGFESLPKKPMFFAPNHKSEFDPLVMLNFFHKNPQFGFPVCVSKKELETDKKIGYAAKLIDSIFIDRENLREMAASIGTQKEILQKRSLIVFPEGTRSKTEEILEFKSGAFVAPIDTLTPIVPVTIYGLEKFVTLKENIMKLKEIDVVFGAPLKHTDYIKFSRDAVTLKTWNAVSETYKKLSEINNKKTLEQEAKKSKK